jgi:hypothetical protein
VRVRKGIIKGIVIEDVKQDNAVVSNLYDIGSMEEI